MSDYLLLSGLKKKQLKVRQFLSDKEVIAAVETGWTDKFLNFFFSSLQKLEQWLSLHKTYVSTIYLF